MKKIISLILALMLVLCMGVAAFAEDTGDAETPSVTGTEAKTFNFTKTYKTTAGNTPATYPVETLQFTVTADQGNPDSTMITIADHSVAGNPDQIIVTVPSYTTVGKWNYTVSEVAGNTKGVTYANTQFGVQVFVSYNEAGTALVAQTSFTTSDGNEGKIDSIVNTYDLGNMSVEKIVSGNLASKTQKFDINVTFTSDKPVLSTITGAATINSSDWTATESGYTYTTTVSLAGGETATFNNIPAGVTYTVEEDAKHAVADANGSDGSKGYTVSYENENASITADGTAAAKVTNTKGTVIDNGISTDSLPYVMLLGIVTMIGAAMLIKRRATNN